MKSSDSIENLLTDLKDQTSPAFDAQTLQAMLAAQGDAGILETSRSWLALGRTIMQMKLTRFAAAIVLVGSILLLGSYLVGGQSATTTPVGTQLAIEEDQPGVDLRESGTDPAVAEAPIEGLGQPELLETLPMSRLDTQIGIAAMLGEMAGASAMGPLRKLADAWRGDSDNNPFLDAIKQIEFRLESAALEPKTPVADITPAQEPQRASIVKQGETGIAGVVIDSLTLEPIEGATVYQRRSDPNTLALTNVQGRFRLVGLEPTAVASQATDPSLRDRVRSYLYVSDQTVQRYVILTHLRGFCSTLTFCQAQSPPVALLRDTLLDHFS